MAIRLSRSKQLGPSSEKLGEEGEQLSLLFHESEVYCARLSAVPDGMGRSLPAHFVMLNDKIPLFLQPDIGAVLPGQCFL